MERDQSGGAQRHGGIAAGRAVIAGTALAGWLALLTWHQAGAWASDEALWTRAHQVAPTAPRPALGLAWVQIRAGRLDEAERWLDRAAHFAQAQSPRERAWALDSVDATRAQIWMRQGKLREAARLMAAGTSPSERWAVCQHFRSVCALAASPP